jgi:hypothetical protein
MQKPRTSTVSAYAWGSRNSNSRSPLAAERHGLLLDLAGGQHASHVCPADEKVSSELKKQIVQARTNKKLTQAQLGQVRGGHHAGGSCGWPAAADITSNCIIM